MNVSFTVGRRTLIVALAALVVALVAVVAVAANPFGSSVAEKVSAKMDSDARCRRAGIQQVAGERETIYTCTYRAPSLEGNPITSNCFAIVDGRVYMVSVDPC